jgi:hypothetical protein
MGFIFLIFLSFLTFFIRDSLVGCSKRTVQLTHVFPQESCFFRHPMPNMNASRVLIDILISNFSFLVAFM